MNNLLTAEEVKVKLNLGINAVYKLMRLKSFPAIRLGNTYRVDEDELEKWIKVNLGKAISLDEV